MLFQVNKKKITQGRMTDHLPYGAFPNTSCPEDERKPRVAIFSRLPRRSSSKGVDDMIGGGPG